MANNSVSRALAALATCLLLSPAAAAANDDALVGVSQAGLDIIAKIVPSAVPKSFATPAISEKLFSCSFLGDTKIKVDPSTISLPLHDVSITAGQGTLTVNAAGDLRVAAKTRFTLCVGSMSCTANVSVSRWTATASFDPSVGAAGVQLSNARVQVDIPSSKTKVWFSGCGLPGAVLNGAISLFKKTIVGKARDALNKALADKVQPFVQARLSEMTQLSKSFGDYKFSGKLTSLASVTGKVSAGASVSIDAAKTAPCAAGAAAAPLPPTPAAAPPMNIGADHIGLALSSRTISATLGAARETGLLCFDQAQLEKIGVDKAKLSLVTLLIGMKGLDSFSARASGAPTVKLVPNSGEARLSLSLPVEVVLDGRGPKGATTVTLASSIDADVALKLDNTKQAIVLDVAKVTLGKLAASASDAFGLNLNLAPLKPAIDTMINAALGGQLSSLEIAPRAFSASSGPLSTFYFYLSRATSTVDWATLFGKLVMRAPGDKTPPLVTFKASAERSAASVDSSPSPGDVRGTPVGGIVTISAKASDSATPADLLRYSFRVDGGDWSDPTHSSKLRAVLADGSHSVEVKVSDISGNVAPTQTLDIVVDTIGPSVSLLDAPSGRIDDPAALRSAISVSDNTTAVDAIEIKLQLRHVHSGELVDETKFEAGVTELPALRLPRTGDYELLVFARDRVGNLGQPARSTFDYQGAPSLPSPRADDDDDVGASVAATQLTGGCNVAPRSTGGSSVGDGPPVMLCLVLVCLAAALSRRRRRRHRRRLR